MQEKTTVTNPSGSESTNPMGAGESLKDIENRVRENLRHENDRKTSELSERLSIIEQEKQELAERLEAAERDRLNNLNQNIDKEEQLRELETKPEFAGYREKIERSRKEAVSEAEHSTSKMIMQDFINRTAREEKQDPVKFREQLNGFLKDPETGKSKYPDLLPYERAQVAYSDYLKQKEYNQIVEENKKLKAERDGFSESGTYLPRQTRTPQELREAHLSGSESAAIDRAKDLDSRQKEYDSQFEKQI